MGLSCKTPRLLALWFTPIDSKAFAAKTATSVKIISEGLRCAEEDALVRQLPQVLPVSPLAAACQLLNGSLQKQGRHDPSNVPLHVAVGFYQRCKPRDVQVLLVLRKCCVIRQVSRCSQVEAYILSHM